MSEALSAKTNKDRVLVFERILGKVHYARYLDSKGKPGKLVRLVAGNNGEPLLTNVPYVFGKHPVTGAPFWIPLDQNDGG